MIYGQEPDALSARDLCEHLTRLYVHCRDRLRDPDWDALQEAMRRVREHKRLVREVVPDLQCCVAELEEVFVREVPWRGVAQVTSRALLPRPHNL